MFGKTKSRGLRGVAAAIAAGAMLLTGFMGATTANADDAKLTIGAGAINIQNADGKPLAATDTFTGYMPFTIKSGISTTTEVDGKSETTYTYAYGINATAGYDEAKIIAIINAANLDGDNATPDIAADASLGTILNWLKTNLGSEKFDSANAQAFAKAVIDNSTGITAAFTDQTASQLSADGKTWPAGYYVIKQTAGSTADKDGKTATFTRYIAGNVEAASPLTATMKNSTVEAEKKIKDDLASLDSNDYNIGDTVYFEFTGKLPATYDDYTTFKYIFHDDMAESLDFKSDSVKVYVNNVDNAKLIPDTQYTIRTGAQAKHTDDDNKVVQHTFDIDFGNLKDVTYDTDKKLTKDDTILIQYSATLNNKATIGGAGNTNEMQLEFSNNPHDGTKTGKTPEDIVTVFTYQLNVNKVDSADSNTKLQGAQFKLWKDSNKAEGAIVANGKLTEWKANEATELTTDARGLISIEGLDSGTYYLEETEAPAGYNKIDHLIPIDLKATTSVDGITNPTITLDGTAGTGNTNGVFEGNVLNNKGTVLPSTGGMGTTILYTVGAIIVAVAGFGLAMVLRRRRA